MFRRSHIPAIARPCPKDRARGDDHQDVSFERLVEELAPARDLQPEPALSGGLSAVQRSERRRLRPRVPSGRPAGGPRNREGGSPPRPPGTAVERRRLLRIQHGPVGRREHRAHGAALSRAPRIDRRQSGLRGVAPAAPYRGRAAPADRIGTGEALVRPLVVCTSYSSARPHARPTPSRSSTTTPRQVSRN